MRWTVAAVLALLCVSLEAAAIDNTLSSTFSKLNHDLRSLIDAEEDELEEADDLDAVTFIDANTKSFDMGMSKGHYDTLQKFVNLNNIVLFVRPSEPDTVRLIEKGTFSTKSVDIHDKSSNWGIHAGLVPFDQYLAKPHTNQPKAPMADVEDSATNVHPHRDGMESGVGIVHLEATSDFLDSISEGVDLARIRSCDDALCGGVDYKCYSPINPPPQYTSVKFCVMRSNNKVYWLQPAVQPRLQKLLVWAYNCRSCTGPDDAYCTHGAPVTGDYDLWMVAFSLFSSIIRLSTPRTHTKPLGPTEIPVSSYVATNSKLPDNLLELFLTETIADVKGGPTFSNIYELELFRAESRFNLNNYLGRKPGFEVFHHSSEMWNLRWTQELPSSVIMITPDNLIPFVHGVNPTDCTVQEESRTISSAVIKLYKKGTDGAPVVLTRGLDYLTSVLVGLGSSGYLWNCNPVYQAHYRVMEYMRLAQPGFEKPNKVVRDSIYKPKEDAFFEQKLDLMKRFVLSLDVKRYMMQRAGADLRSAEYKLWAIGAIVYDHRNGILGSFQDPEYYEPVWKSYCVPLRYCRGNSDGVYDDPEFVDSRLNPMLSDPAGSKESWAELRRLMGIAPDACPIRRSQTMP